MFLKNAIMSCCDVMSMSQDCLYNMEHFRCLEKVHGGHCPLLIDVEHTAALIGTDADGGLTPSVCVTTPALDTQLHTV